MNSPRRSSPSLPIGDQSGTTAPPRPLPHLREADILAAVESMRKAADRTFLGFDPGPDRSVAFAPWRPDARPIELPLLDAPRRPAVYVVPDAWLPGPLALPDGSFVARHSDGRRLEQLPAIDSPLLGRFAAMDLRWILPESPARRWRKSKGWRRYIRRAKAARRHA